MVVILLVALMIKDPTAGTVRRGGTNLYFISEFQTLVYHVSKRRRSPHFLVSHSLHRTTSIDITMSSDDVLELMRIDSIDSNATADNLPGPGRNIGRLYDWLGPRLERVLSIRRLKLGYDPDTVAQDIRDLCWHNERSIVKRHMFPELGLTNVEKKHLKKLCKKLMACVRFVA